MVTKEGQAEKKLEEWKLKILRNLDTKGLIEKMQQYQDELEQALREHASFKDLNREYLTSGASSDCQEVKRILAELTAKGPDTEGKKLTVVEKETWLQRQRTENEELSAAISKQKSIAFLVENNEIKIEMAKRRLEGARAVLALRTAQLNFLSS
jgi:hypothetical protein